MKLWPFTHNWQATYRATWSYKTDVLTAQAGYEQRIAQRDEPRRSLATEVLEDADTARALDRFVWTVRAAPFAHVDPATGYTSVVRFDETETLTFATSNVATASITLAVEPGSDQIVYDEPSALTSFQNLYIFPFGVNWRGGRSDALTLPRRTADFDRGRISVTYPVPFATRVGSALLLQATQDETDALVGFFATMRGRQGEFWAQSELDDLYVLETVSTTLTVEGADAADMFDDVNCAVALTTWSGSIYYRRVVAAAVVGDTTLLSLEADIPEENAPYKRCSWMRVSRFASDDLTVEWSTHTVAQAQVQVQTLPYADPEGMLFGLDPLLDYYGASFFFGFGELLDYIVNVEAPLQNDVMNRSELAFQFGEPMSYIVNRATPKKAEWPRG